MKDLLKKYGILASAVIASSSTSEAQVIYTDLNPDSLIQSSDPILDIDLNNDGIVDFNFSVNSSYYNAQISLIGNGEIVATNDSVFPFNFGYEDIISSGMNFISSAPISNNLFFGVAPSSVSSLGINSNFSPEGDTKFIGVKFKDITNNTYYGWIRVEFDINLSTLRIMDYAYESTPNVGIMLPKNDRNVIHGNVYNDVNHNCIKEIGDIGLSNVIIKTEPGEIYRLTDSAGNYSVGVDSAGTYIVSQEFSRMLPTLSQICPTNNHSILFTSTNQDTTNINFADSLANCAILNIDIISRRRRCVSNTTFLSYYNSGITDASNVTIRLELPNYVNFISADYPYSLNSDSSFSFDIGNVIAGSYGYIRITDSVSCIEGITGLTQCTKAWISPPNASCLGSNSNWDKSNLSIKSKCEANNAVYFTVKNEGIGNMSTLKEVRTFANGLLVNTQTTQLNAGDSSVYLIYNTTGVSLRMEVDQTEGNPTQTSVHADMESCGAVTYGYVAQLSQFDESNDYEEDCKPIVDSYDPNDKQVFPSGLTDNHYVKPNTLLDYQIQFQNTGTDTAYKVVIIDTLSENLDISTIQWGMASHEYEIDVTGKDKPVLIFTFNDIDLVDSLTNETESQGFVKFKIAPKNTLSNGTKIHNSANIYFDFNTLIKTNDAWITIYDTLLTGPSLTVTLVNNVDNKLKIESFKAIPNPFENSFTIILPKNVKTHSTSVKITDVLGRAIELKATQNENKITFDGSKLENGIYLVELIENYKIIGRAKIVKN